MTLHSSHGQPPPHPPPLHLQARWLDGQKKYLSGNSEIAPYPPRGVVYLKRFGDDNLKKSDFGTNRPAPPLSRGGSSVGVVWREGNSRHSAIVGSGGRRFLPLLLRGAHRLLGGAIGGTGRRSRGNHPTRNRANATVQIRGV